MPRTGRVAPDNGVHHVINRGNKKEVVFRESDDFRDFLCLLADASERVPARVLAACAMNNHFHLVLWTPIGAQLSAYMMWLMNAQIRRLQKRHGTIGLGHIYQGRFKNFLVQSDAHLYRVLRYVEANPVRAGLVQQAESYPWSSIGRKLTPDGRRFISEWPVPRPDNWSDYVNSGIPADELATLRNATNRGCPYGDASWVEATVKEHGLESTRNSRGRQPKPWTDRMSRSGSIVLAEPSDISI